ncbi:hypothetical protein LJC58_01300 [Lachnospiraceae bacterium OttesenSCG-928-D06]|nr:hypothetical protein [Lachnospiraceae bacterium OttesenSCG-928-D06]
MILYLSSNQHTNLLDFTGLYVDDTVTIKKMVGSFILKQFIISDMRNFSHCSELILDRSAFRDSDKEFAEAIEEFLIMYNARITVIYEGLKQSDELFLSLIKIGVGNIVSSTEIRQIQAEIKECLSQSGMLKYHAKGINCTKSRIEHYRFECWNIRIAVLSAQARMGATTTAVGLSVWLNSVGGSVSYVEANQSGHLKMLGKAYEMEIDGAGFIFDSVEYRHNEPVKQRNFIVYDIGMCDSENSRNLVVKADIIVICCGIKPYEISYTRRLLKQLETQYAFVLCPFADENLKENYSLALQSQYHQILFGDYQPDMMNPSANRKIYKGIVKDYIEEKKSTLHM